MYRIVYSALLSGSLSLGTLDTHGEERGQVLTTTVIPEHIQSKSLTMLASGFFATSKRTLASSDRYTLEVSSFDGHDIPKRLEYVLEDTAHRLKVCAVDIGGNGISLGDSVKFDYIYPSGERLTFNAFYTNTCRVIINATLSKENNVYSQYHQDSADIADFPVIGTWIIRPLKVKPALEKFVASCNTSYEEFVRSAVLGNQPEIPFHEFCQALEHSQKVLQNAAPQERAGKVITSIKKSLAASLKKIKQ